MPTLDTIYILFLSLVYPLADLIIVLGDLLHTILKNGTISTTQ